MGLLVVVSFSYRQTIFAYPSGGGSYVVSKDNLGEKPALIAGASLLDYVLTVAVSIGDLVRLRDTRRVVDVSASVVVQRPVPPTRLVTATDLPDGVAHPAFGVRCRAAALRPLEHRRAA